MGNGSASSCSGEAREDSEDEDGLEFGPTETMKAKASRQLGIIVAKRDQIAWLNGLLEHMWPDLEQVVKEIVQQRVEPILRSKLPEKLRDMHFSEFSLGVKPPIVDVIENYDLPHGTSGVHCSIIYDSDMVVTMSTGNLSFGMQNFSLRGEIVFLFRPYIEEQGGTGGTGGMTVYFLNPPSIGLEFTGLAGIGDLFGVRGLVRAAIDAALAEKLVLPNSMTQLIGYKDFKVYPIVMGTPSPIGTLRVKTLKATDLPSGDWTFFGMGGGGKDDNYFKLTIGDSAWRAGATTMGESHEFMIFDPEQLLSIDLWDEDQLTDDDHLGTAGPYHLHEAVRLSKKPIQLRDPSTKKPAGTIELSIEYFTGHLQKTGSSGCIIMLQIRELLVDGMQDSKLMVDAHFGEDVRSSAIGKVMRNAQQEAAMRSVLGDMRERFKKHGMKQADIDKLTNEEGLTLRQAKTRIALNAYMLFFMPPDHPWDGTVELKLWDRKGTKEKKALKSNDHANDALLGTAAIPLSSLKNAPDLTLTDNRFPFTSTDGQGTYGAELTLSLCGLEPAEPPIVNMHGLPLLKNREGAEAPG